LLRTLTGREAAIRSAKEKAKATTTAEKRAVDAEKARALAEKRLADLELQWNEGELRLAEAESKNVALAEEIADLWAALVASENKWYDKGFVNAEKGVEPVVMEARQLSFKDGWMTAQLALGVVEDSPLRNPGKVPLPDFTLTAQNLTGPTDDKETNSLRELVEQIDAHVELIGLRLLVTPASETSLEITPSLRTLCLSDSLLE